MKESNFYSDEFEQLIREKTEQYKMYPSENVWKGVHNSLHTKRKWFIGSMAFLVTGILFFSGKELLTPSRPTHKLAAAGSSSIDSINSDPAKTNQPEENTAPNFVRVHSALVAAVAGRHLSTTGTGSVEQEEPDPSWNHLAITISHPVVSQPDLSELLSHAVRLPGAAPSLIEPTREVAETMPKAATPASEPGLLDSWLVRNAPETPAVRRSTDPTTTRNSAEGLRETTEISRESVETYNSVKDGDGDDAAVRSVLESLGARGQHARSYNGPVHTLSARRDALTRIKDSAGSVQASAAAIGEASDISRVNWLHDYAVYTLPSSPSRGRLFLQLILAPTVNFRTISGGTLAAKELGSPVASVHPGDVQSWVNRSPALGFEFGGNLLYRVTRNLTIKGGLQFNYTRYRMLAYTNLPQQGQPTQIAQSQQGPYRTPLGNANYVDSLAAIAPTVASNPSFAPNSVQATLYNDYFQLSAPIGFELRVLGNERLQFNIGATIEPSYLLNTNSYILSSDYTNYSKEPSMFRRWNLNAGVEAFLSYQMGPVRWQVGPEFRYQLFSTYLSNNPYPISENLKGYGIKIGITKPLP
jgi:hypothetical protein